jgi:hypothetical protein
MCLWRCHENVTVTKKNTKKRIFRSFFLLNHWLPIMSRNVTNVTNASHFVTFGIFLRSFKRIFKFSVIELKMGALRVVFTFFYHRRLFCAKFQLRYKNVVILRWFSWGAPSPFNLVFLRDLAYPQRILLNKYQKTLNSRMLETCDYCYFWQR